jgi:hypothetical protein
LKEMYDDIDFAGAGRAGKEQMGDSVRRHARGIIDRARSQTGPDDFEPVRMPNASEFVPHERGKSIFNDSLDSADELVRFHKKRAEDHAYAFHSLNGRNSLPGRYGSYMRSRGMLDEHPDSPNLDFLEPEELDDYFARGGEKALKVAREHHREMAVKHRNMYLHYDKAHNDLMYVKNEPFSVQYKKIKEISRRTPPNPRLGWNLGIEV